MGPSSLIMAKTCHFPLPLILLLPALLFVAIISSIILIIVIIVQATSNFLVTAKELVFDNHSDSSVPAAPPH